MTETTVRDLETDVKIIQKDLVSFQSLLDKFDVTVQKLMEVSNNLNKLIALQDARLGLQERISNKINERMDAMKKEIDSDLQRQNIEIIQRIKDLGIAQQNTSKEIFERIGALDKWRYTILGAAIVVGFLLSKLPIITDLIS